MKTIDDFNRDYDNARLEKQAVGQSRCSPSCLLRYPFKEVWDTVQKKQETTKEQESLPKTTPKRKQQVSKQVANQKEPPKQKFDYLVEESLLASRW